jgi:hypothetical protein
VPAHRISGIKDIQGLLMTKPVDGWYAFCNRPAHVPRGVSVWSGKSKNEGTVVEEVLPSQKAEGLEQFPMWETGIVIGGFEKHRAPEEFRPSCTFVPVMNLILQLYRTEKSRSDSLPRMHRLVFESIAGKKPLFFSLTWEEFSNTLGNNPTLEDLIRLACSRCGVVVCLNRQAPFFDMSLLKRLIRAPDTVQVIKPVESKKPVHLHPAQ